MASPTYLTLLMLAQASTPTPTATPTPAPTTNAQSAGGAKIQAAAQAFSGCVQGKVTSVPTSLSPEAGADRVLADCKTEQTGLEQAVGAMIATAPADRQASARQQLQDGIAMARTQIADGIRRSRAAAPATSPK